MLPRESAESEGCSKGTPREGQVLGENEGRRQSRAGVTRLFFEPLVEPRLELFRIVGDQARGQAAGNAAERHVRDAHQPQCFERAVRAPKQVGSPSERACGDRDEVGGEVGRGVRDRRLVYLRDVARRLETMPAFHGR